MERYFIELGFDGFPFNGWQKQPNATTIQELLEKAMATLLRQPIEVTGAGRTDTQVHATSYTAHFDTPDQLSTEQRTDLIYRLNRILPPEIAVYNIHHVKPDIHARFSALSRSYEYHIARIKSPFLVNRAWFMDRPVDLGKMQNACNILRKHDDFECFSKSNTQVNHYRCKIFEADWEERGQLLVFKITADRFLRNMVRAIVGTMMDVGSGKLSIADFEKVLESRNRSKAGYSVPGYGLYFMGAGYEPDIFLD